MFRVLRDDFEPDVVRILYSGNGVIKSLDDGTYKAANPGQANISLIPKVYDWDNALEIKILVIAEP
jgi:hypothetical protein